MLGMFIGLLLLGCESEKNQTLDEKKLNEQLRQLTIAKSDAYRDLEFKMADYAESLHREAALVVVVEELRIRLKQAEGIGESTLLLEDMRVESDKLRKLAKQNDVTYDQMNAIVDRFPDERQSRICRAIDDYRSRLLTAAKTHAECASGPSAEKIKHAYWRLSLMSDFDAEWFLKEFGRSGDNDPN